MKFRPLVVTIHTAMHGASQRLALEGMRGCKLLTVKGLCGTVEGKAIFLLNLGLTCHRCNQPHLNSLFDNLKICLCLKEITCTDSPLAESQVC